LGAETRWVRSLVAGLDTVVILCVNDDCANDRLGTTIRPVENAKLDVILGTVNVSRLLVVTSDAGLCGRLRKPVLEQ